MNSTYKHVQYIVCLSQRQGYYKYNHRMECIRKANARHKVIIFCKSCPLNWQLGDLYPIHLVDYFY